MHISHIERILAAGIAVMLTACTYVGSGAAPPSNAMSSLEEAETEPLSHGKDSHVREREANGIYAAVTDSVCRYMAMLDSVESKISSLPLDSCSILGMEAYRLQTGMKEYIRDAIEKNIGNLQGIYLLIDYNEFFTLQELKEMSGMIPEETAGAHEALYARLMECIGSRSGI
jgi:hypothetical protein